jgi:P-type E1-E2 ATPase
MPKGITLDLPGKPSLLLRHLVLDYTGTLSLDGKLLPGAARAIRTLSKHLKITVLTADTFGTARRSLKKLPVDVRLIKTGRDKQRFMREIHCENTVAIGNGRNDLPMLKSAALGIAVAGPEGCAAELVCEADLLVFDIRQALDLLKHPLRIKATLRQ